jgi:UDP-N-acetyl-D-glucosamine dehydrogenase
LRLDGHQWSAHDFACGIQEADCVVIVTDHKVFDYQLLVEHTRLIVDTRNALKGLIAGKIVRI